MGLAIIALTFVLKFLVLPLAYKSYVSMARMKELQPEMEALKERAGEDRQRLQREMMQLYKDKKVNPAAGCLPILIQIPIFFALYKVIFVTIELRHAPFFGWLRDLSAPDPSSLYNFFGLLPWDAPVTGSVLHLVFIGLLPILLGDLDVAAAEAEPGAQRSGAAADLRLDALGVHVHAGKLCQRPCGLLDHQQHDHLHPAVPDHVEPRQTPDIFGNIKAAKLAKVTAKAPEPPPTPPKKGKK
jgi:YidC/Oxa1 family membrane protein insertase